MDEAQVRLACRERCARSSRASAGSSGTVAALASVLVGDPLAVGAELARDVSVPP